MISLWPQVGEDELRIHHLVHTQFNSVSNFAESQRNALLESDFKGNWRINHHFQADTKTKHNCRSTRSLKKNTKFYFCKQCDGLKFLGCKESTGGDLPKRANKLQMMQFSQPNSPPNTTKG